MGLLWWRKRGATDAYHAAFHEAAVGVSHTSIDGRFIKVNRRFCAMLGYSEAELLMLAASQITAQDGADTSLHRQALLAGKTPLPQLEKRYVKKDGTELWMVASISLVRDSDGNPEYFISTVQDATERKIAQQRLEQQAYHDGLTGLPNRELMEDRLAQVLNQARRRGIEAAVLFIDLDHFKQVNDSLGHAVGDALLREAAERLRSCVRAADTVARMGGDEFVVLLSEVSRAQDAAIVASKIVERISRPFLIEGQTAFVTASVGIATFPSDGVIGDALLKNADAAMFRAKQTGRNSFKSYNIDDGMEILLEDGVVCSKLRGEAEFERTTKMIARAAQTANSAASNLLLFDICEAIFRKHDTIKKHAEMAWDLGVSFGYRIAFLGAGNDQTIDYIETVAVKNGFTAKAFTVREEALTWLRGTARGAVQRA
jgi:diguanylate cyclase (GGDEF)-like protein/PAS domain S-box-containing protein